MRKYWKYIRKMKNRIVLECYKILAGLYGQTLKNCVPKKYGEDIYEKLIKGGCDPKLERDILREYLFNLSILLGFCIGMATSMTIGAGIMYNKWYRILLWFPSFIITGITDDEGNILFPPISIGGISSEILSVIYILSHLFGTIILIHVYFRWTTPGKCAFNRIVTLAKGMEHKARIIYYLIGFFIMIFIAVGILGVLSIIANIRGV